jgi:hypothetical protein
MGWCRYTVYKLSWRKRDRDCVSGRWDAFKRDGCEAVETGGTVMSKWEAVSRLTVWGN